VFPTPGSMSIVCVRARLCAHAHGTGTCGSARLGRQSKGKPSCAPCEARGTTGRASSTLLVFLVALVALLGLVAQVWPSIPSI